jgi:hypothetical protein
MLRSMPIKRQPSEAELDALAERFRALWRAGDVLRPWLRKHHAMFRALVHDDWSWAAVAVALTRAGITWRTGRAWSAEGLRREVVRASLPLKSRGWAAEAPAPASSDPASGAPAGPQAAAASPVPAQAAPAPAPPPSGSTVPRFKPASLKPYEPQRPPTADEEKEREAVRKKIYG